MRYGHRLGLSFSLASSALLAMGCSSIRAQRGIEAAEAGVEEAQRENADHYARYEVTKAQLYLDEARQKNGYGDYAIAQDYAAVSAETALNAAQLARQRRDMERRRGKPKGEEESVLPADPTAPVPVPGVTPEETPRERPKFVPPPTDDTGKKKLLPPGMGGGQ